MSLSVIFSPWPTSFFIQKRVLMVSPMLAVLAMMVAMVTGCSEKRSPEPPNLGSPMIPNIALQRVFQNIDIKSPLWLTQAPVANSDWYVLEKNGRILRFSDDYNTSTHEVFLDITDRVDNSANEGGLLGMAFHPAYADNYQVYLSYTQSGSPLTSHIARFESLDAGASLAADSEHAILKVPQPYSNHNGGHIVFGADQLLYIGLGDGGSGGDPKGHGQDINTLLGALLRIDVNTVDVAKNQAYGVPNDNPFVNQPQGLPEIYAWGLRNPWRWSFDRKTQALWLADVGQNNWEEINLIKKGGNYGWNIREGAHCYRSQACDTATLQDPVSEYSHEQGCSITGGFVYRGEAIPQLQGAYLFSDFCSGTIWALIKQNDGQFQTVTLLESGLNIASFSEGKDGELYVLHLGGEIHKIIGQVKQETSKP